MPKSIYQINQNLPITTKISTVNDMVVQVDGKVSSNDFNLEEIDSLYTDLTMNRQFLRNQSLGHTLLNYTSWVNIYSEVGYDIWKINPTHYKYNDVNQLFLDNKLLDNRGEASSEMDSDSVISRLALTEAEILNEEWAWCTYDDYIYVTIRNTGVTAYEGDYFIASSSSSNNLKNFFISNHEFKANYEDSTYTPSTPSFGTGGDIDGGGA
jgi:hypothetical protein